MKHNNFYYLFFALLVLLVATPIARDLDLLSERLDRTLGFVVVLAIGVWSFQGSRVVFAVGMLLACAGIIVSLVALLRHGTGYSVASLLIYLAFLILAIVASLKQVAVSSEISINRVVGAVCVYLMLGAAWAIAYALLYASSPDAFSVPDAGTDVLAVGYWMYFSFVTLTTLGYGDIVPISASARALAYAEAILGQFYIAILVAGLVSAYISAQQGGAGRR